MSIRIEELNQPPDDPYDGPPILLPDGSSSRRRVADHHRPLPPFEAKVEIGALQIQTGLNADKSAVVVDLGTPTRYFTLSGDQALAMANALNDLGMRLLGGDE